MSLIDDLLDMACVVARQVISKKIAPVSFKGVILSRGQRTVQNCCDRQVRFRIRSSSLKFQHYLGIPFASAGHLELAGQTRSNSRPAAPD